MGVGEISLWAFLGPFPECRNGPRGLSAGGALTCGREASSEQADAYLTEWS
jgi:hypothetical protein